MSEYVCPNCGSEETPAMAMRCAERITYFHCRDCDFSTWDIDDYHKHRTPEHADH